MPTPVKRGLKTHPLLPKGVKVVPPPKSKALRALLEGPDITASGGANVVFRSRTRDAKSDQDALLPNGSKVVSPPANKTLRAQLDEADGIASGGANLVRRKRHIESEAEKAS
jgi:hypothetical protein